MFLAFCTISHPISPLLLYGIPAGTCLVDLIGVQTWIGKGMNTHGATLASWEMRLQNTSSPLLPLMKTILRCIPFSSSEGQWQVYAPVAQRISSTVHPWLGFPSFPVSFFLVPCSVFLGSLLQIDPLPASPRLGVCFLREPFHGI